MANTYNNQNIPQIFSDATPADTMEQGMVRWKFTNTGSEGDRYVYYCRLSQGDEFKSSGFGCCFPLILYKKNANQSVSGAFVHMFINPGSDEWKTHLQAVMNAASLQGEVKAKLFSRNMEDTFDHLEETHDEYHPDRMQKERILLVKDWLIGERISFDIVHPLQINYVEDASIFTFAKATMAGRWSKP